MFSEFSTLCSEESLEKALGSCTLVVEFPVELQMSFNTSLSVFCSVGK